MLSQYPSLVGVSGFTSSVQVAAALGAFPKKSERKFLVGVLANSEIISGNCSKYPQMYPKKEEIPAIFMKDSRVVNVLCVHGARKDHFCEDLVDAMEIAGKNCDGVQLCVSSSWPTREDLENFALDVGAKTIILRVGSVAIQKLGSCPELLAEKIEAYDDCVDYVMINRNGNGGKLLGIDFLEKCFDALAAKKLRIGFGVMGGMSAETLPAIEPLVSNFGASVVAETELQGGNGRLDPNLVAAYVAKASRLAGKHAA